VSGLASKSLGRFLIVWVSKRVATSSDGLASKPAATVSPGLTSKPVIGFLIEPQNQDGGGFPGLNLKTGSFNLVIWTSKSLRRFLGLSLKTKQTSVYRLCHKTDGGRSTWNMRQDLPVCFTWKQVGLGFSSLS
jgi:hypothetical protein